MKSYPNKFVKKCNGKYFIYNPYHATDETEIQDEDESADYQENDRYEETTDTATGNELPGNLVQDVIAELEKLESTKKPWYQNLLILAISIILFLSLGLIKNPVNDIILIVVVIFIHELGHLAAMKTFGYKNVQMFFIPLLGAAVKGESYTATGTHKALVALAGPIPGIFIGLLLSFYYYNTSNDLIKQIATTFIFINAFNMLPFYPFDGGRFMNDVLFARNRYIEAVFKLITGSILLIIGLADRAWLLCILAMTVLLSIQNVFKINTIAKDLKTRIDFGARNTDLKNAPPEVITEILRKINASLPSFKKPKMMAQLASNVWERIITKPPGIFISIVMLIMYLIILVITFAFFAILIQTNE